MTEIFKFENQDIRFEGTPEEPWWVAADICRVLEISNVSQKLETLDDDERSMFNIGRQGNTWCVNESGLYSLILTSRKPQAKKFKKWITSEVLSALRKTGTYSMAQPQPKPGLSIADAILLANVGLDALKNVGIEKETREQIRLQGLIKVIPESAELLQLSSNAIATSNPLPDAPMTPTEVEKKLASKLGLEKISGIKVKVNRKLLELGYQQSMTCINSKGKEVHDYYQATSKGEKHSKLLLSVYYNGEGNSTKSQLRWFKSGVEILASNWDEN